MSTDNSNELESNQENSKPEGMSVPQKTYTNKLYRKKSAQQFQGTRQDEYQPLNLQTDCLKLQQQQQQTISSVSPHMNTYSPHRHPIHSPSNYKQSSSSSLPPPPPFPVQYQNNSFHKQANFNRSTNYQPSAYNRSARYRSENSNNNNNNNNIQENFSHSPTSNSAVNTMNRNAYTSRPKVFTMTSNEVSQENSFCNQQQVNVSINNTPVQNHQKIFSPSSLNSDTSTNQSNKSSDLGDSSIVSVLSSSTTQTSSSNQNSLASSSCSSSTHQSPPHDDPETSIEAINYDNKNKLNDDSCDEPVNNVENSEDQPQANNYKHNASSNQYHQLNKLSGQRRHFNSLSVSSNNSTTSGQTSASFHSSGTSSNSENRNQYAYAPQSYQVTTNQSMQHANPNPNYYYNQTQNQYQAYQNNNSAQLNTNNAPQTQVQNLNNNSNQQLSTPIQHQSHPNQMPINMNQIYYPTQPVMGQYVIIDTQKMSALTNNLNSLSLTNSPYTNTQYTNLTQYTPTTLSNVSGSQPVSQPEAYTASPTPFPIANSSYSDPQHQLNAQNFQYQQQQQQQIQTQFLPQPAYYKVTPYIHIPNSNDNAQPLASPYYVTYAPPLNHAQYTPVSNMDQVSHQQQHHLSSNNTNVNSTSTKSTPLNQPYSYHHNVVPYTHMHQFQAGSITPNNLIKVNQPPPSNSQPTIQQIQPIQQQQQQMAYNQQYYHNYQAINQFSPSSSIKSSQNQTGSSFVKKKSCFNCRSQSHVATECSKTYVSMQQTPENAGNINSNLSPIVNTGNPNTSYQNMANENNSSGLSRESSDLAKDGN